MRSRSRRRRRRKSTGRNIEEQITALYKEHNPEKLLDKVPSLVKAKLKNYKGREGELLRKMQEKHSQHAVYSVCNYVIEWSNAPMQVDAEEANPGGAVEGEDSKPSWGQAGPFRRVHMPTAPGQPMPSGWAVAPPIILDAMTMTPEARELLQQLAREAQPQPRLAPEAEQTELNA